MDQTVQWLLTGDVSIQFLTHKLLLHSSPEMLAQLQAQIPLAGYGARFLAAQNPNGHWGIHYYQTKWTSTHYTLIDLKKIGSPTTLAPCRQMIQRMFDECQTANGGLNLSKSDLPSDVCVDGMILEYSAYFCPEESGIPRLIDHLLSVQKTDGGFSWNQTADISDPHTTICVLEGFAQCFKSGIPHKSAELLVARNKAIECLLSNGLFQNGFDPRYLKLTFPYRYRYDLLRVLEYFADNNIPYDERMKPAFVWLASKQKQDGFWYLEYLHPGNVHFRMEETKCPSRFISLKALHILDWYSQVSNKKD